MKLTRLTVRNFKGAREFALTPHGADTTVYGENAAGKTTLADAFYWCLFGKDSHNQADFEIKTLASDGKPIANLEHSVEVELDVDGATTTFGRTYKEVHTKKRGSATSEFAGHTTDYFVNTVPVQMGEFKARVGSICSEKLFRLLTDPTYFLTQVSWQDRRKALLEVCGDVADADVIARNADLCDLPSILGAHSIDEYRKIAASKQRAINDELRTIPSRIDEVRRGIGDDRPTIDVAPLRARVQDLQEERARVTAGGAVAEKQVEIRKHEAELVNIENRLRAEASKGRDQVEADYRDARRRAGDAKNALDVLERRHATEVQTIDALEVELDKLRREYREINSQTFQFVGSSACAACGQDLPEDRVEAARAKAEEAFNLRKSDQLTANKTVGMQKKSKLTERIEERDRLAREIEAARDSSESLARTEAELRAQLDTCSVPTINLEGNAYYNEVRGKIRALQAEIESIQGNHATALADVDARIREAQLRVTDAEAQNAAAKRRASDLARIDELSTREKELSSEFETLSGHLHLCEQFVRAKVAMLTDQINGRFEIARWKLFEDQINGGLAECCEATVNGVPYDSLNHGMRINVGLDVINTLAGHHGFAPPIFIDGAESVTSILPTRGQQIRLVVSASDKTLRVETAPVAQGALY